VLPLTIRNAIVFHRFIPLSLGAGQTLLEGIADYDEEGKLGIPKTDMGVMKMESEELNRPDYYETLFKPDGVERDRWRLSRGFAVIRAHPFWFSGVMARRAASMLRLERSRLISTDPPVSHSLDAIGRLQPVWTNSQAELRALGLVAPQARAVVSSNGEALVLTGDNEKYGEQLQSAPAVLKGKTDYVVTVPVKIEHGRIKISVRNQSGHVYASTIVETIETMAPDAQPVNQIQLGFVAASDDRVQVVFSNEASNPPNPVAQLGAIKLFELGPSRFLWTRYPRFLIHAAQRLFLTAVMLPLVIMGLALLIIEKRRRALIILTVVPIYFFSVQSILHTEYRYVLPVVYFLFALAAVTVSWVINLVMASTSTVLARKS